MADYTGDSGDNTQVGSADDDSFDYSQGGHDTLAGGDGDDGFYMGATLDPLDVIDGGDQTNLDDVEISGDYSAGLTITPAMFISIEGLVLDAGDYRLKLADGVVGAGGSLAVTMLPGAAGVFDASALTAGSLQFGINAGVEMRVVGGAGDDTFETYSPDRALVLIGGGGADEATLQPQADFRAAGHSFTGIETLRLVDSHRLTLADGNTAAGQTLSVIGFSGLSLDVDGHKETDGHYQMTGDALADRLIGGHLADTLAGAAGDDTLIGGAGADQLTGGTGADTFVFRVAADSTVAAPDLITDLEDSDHIDLSAIDADKHTAGVQHFTLVQAFDGHAGELTLSYDAGAGVTRLLGDLNGDRVAEMEIDISGDHSGFTGLVLGG